jgi:hypothetical protein
MELIIAGVILIGALTAIFALLHRVFHSSAKKPAPVREPTLLEQSLMRVAQMEAMIDALTRAYDKLHKDALVDKKAWQAAWVAREDEHDAAMRGAYQAGINKGAQLDEQPAPETPTRRRSVPEQEPLFVSRLPIDWPSMTAVEAKEWLPKLADPEQWDQSDPLLPTVKGWLEDTIELRGIWDKMQEDKAKRAESDGQT